LPADKLMFDDDVDDDDDDDEEYDIPDEPLNEYGR
jgi:hypothetical protein